MANDETEVFTGLSLEEANKLEAQYKALGYSVEKSRENGTYKIVATPPR